MSIESDKLIIARLCDALKMTELKCIPSFLGFLNEREFSACKVFLDNKRVKYTFSGGFDNAERLYIALLPEWTETADFPFKCIYFTYKKSYTLTHRDFLGTIMSLGIERDKVGDIIVKNGEAYVFISDSVVDFCLENISKVGGVGVVSAVYDGEIEFERNFEHITKTVASDRADCVFAAVCNVSRESAKELIVSGNMIVNHIVCENISHRIKSGDVLSLRKKGKYVIESIDDKTRKGRLKLLVKKYI